MKGVILAGGLGTRLRPLTHACNKHLLPVWNKPMIYYPIVNLVKSGIKDIMIVSNDPDTFYKLVRKLQKEEVFFKQKNVSFMFGHQRGEGGIADALKVAREFVDGDSCCVMLGDNIYQFNCSTAVRSFKEFLQYSKRESGALIVTKMANKAKDLTRFGCTLGRHGDIEKIIEKPEFDDVVKYTESGYSMSIITGCYCYTPDVFDVCDKLKPSGRGELEIADVNNHYLAMGGLEEYMTDGWWSDAGTHESLLAACNLVRKGGSNYDEPE